VPNQSLETPTQILEILNKRYETAKKNPTDRNKKNLEIISQLYNEFFDSIMKHTKMNNR